VYRNLWIHSLGVTTCLTSHHHLLAMSIVDFSLYNAYSGLYRLVWVRCLSGEGACLTPSILRFLGANAPRQKILENPFRYISRGHGDIHSCIVAKFDENRSEVKMPSGIPDKKPKSSTSPMTPKISWPVHVGLYRISCGSVAVCRSYSQKTDFSDPQSCYNI